MPLRTLLSGFVVWVLYPLWLAARFLDYLLHRRTRIELTSGPTESWLHVAQFASLAVPVALLAFFRATPLALALAGAALLAHTALSLADVSFTTGRRHISALEQHAHALLVVLPPVAVAIVAILHWGEATTASWSLQPRSDRVPLRDSLLFAGSYFLLAGAPIAEELLRTLKRFRHHQVEHDHEREERDDPERDPQPEIAVIPHRQRGTGALRG